MPDEAKTPFQGERPCPCKRKGCPRYGDCDACHKHHHLPGKKMLTTCERKWVKKATDDFTTFKQEIEKAT